ncbi:unnamed protein product [Adineta steineri]|uniref:Uncharacterized protein n=1 Tax=Adineta steineri TaxID=433720 RepID=A0A815B9V0_9BILA|nr:unnamed protein product [Adineta steineri]CAF1554923.1 unnamed protein product [Adineta steineri]
MPKFYPSHHHRSTYIQARPFDEFLIGQPIDHVVSSGGISDIQIAARQDPSLAQNYVPSGSFAQNAFSTALSRPGPSIDIFK